jgi:hypothetical protein
VLPHFPDLGADPLLDSRLLRGRTKDLVTSTTQDLLHDGDGVAGIGARIRTQTTVDIDGGEQGLGSRRL